MIETPLFEGKRVRICEIDPEKTAAEEARWTYDLDVASYYRPNAPRPLAAFEIQKFYEGHKKDLESMQVLYFLLRRKADDQLIGFFRVRGIQISHRTAWFDLVIAEPKGQAETEEDALRLALRYLFLEINLDYVTMRLSETRFGMEERLKAAGFSLDVRQRGMVYRRGRTWDLLHYGLRRRSWMQKQGLEVEE